MAVNTSKSMVTIRMPVTVKQQLVTCLDAMDLGISSYFSMAAKQLISQQKVPFDFVPVTQARQSTNEPKVMTSFRLPTVLKPALNEALSQLNLTISLYFVMAAEALIRQQRVPFAFQVIPIESLVIDPSG